jgi:hypothetical protein
MYTLLPPLTPIFEPFPGSGHSVSCLKQILPAEYVLSTPLHEDFYSFVKKITLPPHVFVFTNPPFVTRKRFLLEMRLRQCSFCVLLPAYAMRDFSTLTQGTLDVFYLPKRVRYLKRTNGQECNNPSFETVIFIYKYSVLPFQTHVHFIQSIPYFPLQQQCKQHYLG